MSDTDKAQVIAIAQEEAAPVMARREVYLDPRADLIPLEKEFERLKAPISRRRFSLSVMVKGNRTRSGS